MMNAPQSSLPVDQSYALDPGEDRSDRLPRPQSAGDELREDLLKSLVEPGLESGRTGLTRWIAGLPRDDRGAVARQLNAMIARVDSFLEDQLNRILHHPRFQELEAAWRGLKYLVDRAADEGSDQTKVAILNLAWPELVRDVERAVEFDQSALFKKVYDEQFGTAGGEPLGVLIGNYQIRPRPAADHRTDDLAALRHIAQVAAAAFCPFIASAHPSLFGLDHFHELESVENLERGFDSPEFLKWKAFRESEDARFVALTLPRILMRAPYQPDAISDRGFCFRETVEAPDLSELLWGSAAFAYGEVLIRAFGRYGWLGEIRGVARDEVGGGLVTGLPELLFPSAKQSGVARSPVELVLTEQQDALLGQLGFLPLVQCYDTPYSAFFGSQSVQKAKTYDSAAATQNARMAAMLNYTLCVSRFAHYIKVLARDKIGSFRTPEECGRMLHDWIIEYVTPDEAASIEAKARRPLKEAAVDIRPQPGKPGSYLCTVRLCPHYQFESLNASIQLRTTVSSHSDITPV